MRSPYGRHYEGGKEWGKSGGRLNEERGMTWLQDSSTTGSMQVSRSTNLPLIGSLSLPLHLDRL